MVQVKSIAPTRKKALPGTRGSRQLWNSEPFRYRQAVLGWRVGSEGKALAGQVGKSEFGTPEPM